MTSPIEHPPQEKPLKKRPRPANLDLKDSTHSDSKSSNMSQYAMQCLSPGLPPLDPQMQSTILISKTIEQQQRQLIAARQTPTGLTAPLESLSIPSSTKRLKRNAPPPLNLQQQHLIARPTIMSAPSHHYHQFQQYLTPKTASKPGFQNIRTKNRLQQPGTAPLRYPSTATTSSFTPMTPYGIRKATASSTIQQQVPPSATAIPPYQYQYSGARTGIPKSAIYSSHQPRSAIPKTAGGNSTARYRGFRMKREEGVVDVFHKGERMAPLAAQPLSAQREFFDHGEINIRPSSAIPKDQQNEEQGIKKIPKKSIGGNLKIEEKIQEESESDVENNAIEPEAEEAQGILGKDPIDGELRILNNVFRFRFERNGKDLNDDKQRFLNHCETAWDEFIKLGN
ncbi:hypothetical protein BN7_248 [Wickerhamomyces ciferrii]|uniref:Uncharacterized protein n=1 Tax=Wickerhamomyces ciferrii (strain ATCC 14091 / BCRC 22168 / CBS 111 / JCM 3599 / NBRC 0793 / NRRL Y-1031 F-60-10) TaxID=1206466 RepID=K0KH66_WICCF|nr:uncharacterized protein BN7_248 [Wickerhamomyces ciferrii]CCH40714.1 hypothetical protein BN7_248 [Wickerhamomyces ciferrii]